MGISTSDTALLGVTSPELSAGVSLTLWPWVAIVKNGANKIPTPADAAQNQNTMIYGLVDVCKATALVDSALYTLAEIPSPTAPHILLTVLKMPPARDCCF